MKNVVKCYKDFFGYFNALKTHSEQTIRAYCPNFDRYLYSIKGPSPVSFQSPSVNVMELTSPDRFKLTNYGHTKAISLILCGPNSNSNPNPK